MKAREKDIKGLELSNKGNLHKEKERRFGIEKQNAQDLSFPPNLLLCVAFLIQLYTFFFFFVLLSSFN
jgi:hypothetical protein